LHYYYRREAALTGLSRDDRKFLMEVDRRARAGQTQRQIAGALGLKSSADLHARVNRLGCRLRARPVTEVRVSLTGQTLAEFLGEAVAA
jgi:hypothetical protein